MGVLFSFLQADDKEAAQSIIEWLTRDRLLPISDFKPGRIPTYAELRQVLDQMEGYKIDYRVNQQTWDVWLTAPNGDGALLCSVGDGHWTGNENVPSSIYWTNAIEVILPIAQKLANICGTITIINGSDIEDLIFIFPDQSE